MSRGRGFARPIRRPHVITPTRRERDQTKRLIQVRVLAGEDGLQGIVVAPVDGWTGAVNIRALAEALNKAATAYEIGGLQEMRARLHSRRRASRTLFGRQTIYDTYAFHFGGRKELQFNIGEERRDGHRIVLRHGVAFSLRTSQTLPSIDELRPKIARFNEYVREKPEDFPGFIMWRAFDGVLQGEHSVIPIENSWVKEGSFIMVGRRGSPAEASVTAILDDFDRLLPLYTYVESDGPLPLAEIEPRFRPRRCPDVALTTTALVKGATVDVSLRHWFLQKALERHLWDEAGENNVSIDEPLGGFAVRVDAVVQTPDGFVFYEIKTAAELQSCIRQALGQLMEYALWPDANRAIELIVVGEGAVDPNGAKYLRMLRDRFRLPIWYRQLALDGDSLGPKV